MSASGMRALRLAVGLAALFPALAWAASVTVVVPAVSGPAGERRVAAFVVKNPGKLAAFETFVLYDPDGLEPASASPAEPAELTQNAAFDSQIVSPGRLRVRLAQAEAIKGPGILFTVAFIIKNPSAVKPLRLEKPRAISEGLDDLEVATEAEPLPAQAPSAIQAKSGSGGDFLSLLVSAMQVLVCASVLLVLWKVSLLIDKISAGLDRKDGRH